MGYEETLRHGFYQLEYSHRICFENHESTLTTWALLKSGLLSTLTTVMRKERAEHFSQTRTEHLNEGAVIFDEEMK